MKIDKSKLDKIVDTLVTYFEYDVTGSHQYGFDIVAYIRKRDEQMVIDELNNIMEE